MLPDGTSLVLENINNDGMLYYYIIKDHLGSSGLVLDENANIVYWNGEEQRYSFDAWGRLADFNWYTPV